MSEYEKELKRLLEDWDLQTRDAEMSVEARRIAEESAVKKSVAILVDQLGYSHEEALRIIKTTGRFKTYFAYLESD
jgi:hypothetical protein